MRLLKRRVRNEDGPATPPAASARPASGDGLPGVRASKQDSAQAAALSARLDELGTRAQFARQRYDLYKAKSYGPHLTSPARLRELERESERAQAALQFAKEEESQDVLSSPKRPRPR
ncbi:MAG: hypothetical protein ABI323_09415 [Solirubrobacteraceae bacterium]